MSISSKETQIIFRLEKSQLYKLDRMIKLMGYRTRNEWFRHNIREFISKAEKEAYEKELSRLDIDDISDEEIVEMVRSWRKKKRTC